jgi:hypothetical protein
MDISTVTQDEKGNMTAGSEALTVYVAEYDLTLSVPVSFFKSILKNT